MPTFEIGHLQIDRATADHQHVAERHRRERDEHGKDRQEGAEQVQELVGARRDDVLLGEHLDRVGDQRVDDAEVERQEATEDVGAVGADAVLDERAALALDPEQHDAQVEHHQQHRRATSRPLSRRQPTPVTCPRIPIAIGRAAQAQARAPFFHTYASPQPSTPRNTSISTRPGTPSCAEHDRPRIHEDHLDVEDDEEDGDEVEVHREAAARRPGRRIAALEDLRPSPDSGDAFPAGG